LARTWPTPCEARPKRRGNRVGAPGAFGLSAGVAGLRSLGARKPAVGKWWRPAVETARPRLAQSARAGAKRLSLRWAAHGIEAARCAFSRLRLYVPSRRRADSSRADEQV